jgi:hypothetical protein
MKSFKFKAATHQIWNSRSSWLRSRFIQPRAQESSNQRGRSEANWQLKGDAIGEQNRLECASLTFEPSPSQRIAQSQPACCCCCCYNEIILLINRVVLVINERTRVSSRQQTEREQRQSCEDESRNVIVAVPG